MKIRMIASLSGLRDGQPWPAPGSEIVVPDAEGAELCAIGHAAPVASPAEAEKRPAPADAEKRPARRAVKSVE
jgi:hypothetical protein